MSFVEKILVWCVCHTRGPENKMLLLFWKKVIWKLEFFLQPPLSDYYLQAFSINLAKLKESNIRLQVWLVILNKSNKGLVNIININLTNEYDLLLFLKSRGLLDPRIRMCIIWCTSWSSTACMMHVSSGCVHDAWYDPDTCLYAWCGWNFVTDGPTNKAILGEGVGLLLGSVHKWCHQFWGYVNPPLLPPAITSFMNSLLPLSVTALRLSSYPIIIR